MDDFEFSTDYWDQGFMTMADEWNNTWDNGSDFYVDPDCDAIDSL